MLVMPSSCVRRFVMFLLLLITSLIIVLLLLLPALELFDSISLCHVGSKEAPWKLCFSYFLFFLRGGEIFSLLSSPVLLLHVF